MSRRRPQVAVIGGGEAPAPALQAAEELGRALVDAGLRVVCGGLGGVMAAAARGGRSSPRWREGMIVGILPGLDPAAANQWIDVAICTGLGHLRNGVVVTSADAVIAVHGCAGTLSELAMAWIHGRPVVALDLGDDGWASRLAGQAIDGRRADAIARATAPDEAVRLVCARLGWNGQAPEDLS